MLSDLVVFFLVNLPGNLYQDSVLRDTLNVIISLICMFAIYISLIAGFWLRLSTTINVFGVGSSQPLLLKKTVMSNKSHIFEILVWVNILQPWSVFQCAVKFRGRA